MNTANNMRCKVCGGDQFSDHEVLWPDLINQWQLSPTETAYINRQQGTICIACRNSLRSIALAGAICRHHRFPGTLMEFVESKGSDTLRVLEINEAGGLTATLARLRGHELACYPEHDMCDLRHGTGSFDLIVHSDTLEHIPNPIRALSECARVLRDGGACIFTVPIIVDRMTRSRGGLPPSYHGQADVQAADQQVYSEFGADVWQTVLKAGFASCEIYSLEYPSALAITAKR